MPGGRCVLTCYSLVQSVSNHILSPYHEPNINWDVEIQHEDSVHLMKRRLLVQILEKIDNYKLSNILSSEYASNPKEGLVRGHRYFVLK